MESILFLLFTPLAMAALILVLKHPILQRIIAITTSVGLIGCTLWTLNQYFHSPNQYYLVNATEINYVMMAIETLLAAYICLYRHQQAPAADRSHVGSPGHRHALVRTGGIPSSEAMGSHLFIDKLSLLMVAIIAIVGSLIIVFAVPYMEDHHHHHPEQPDRSRKFLALLLVFLTAMFGIVLSNDLIWMLLFLGTDNPCAHTC